MESAHWDLIIRGGRIVDGSGAEPFDGDIAVQDGKIAAVGKVDGSAAEEIDARGMLVTPGFVDIHTHFDGQATWDEQLSPSSWHGVTTVVMGNCGVGFAPCRPEDRTRLVRLMEGVEDIPEAVLNKGLPWTWQSFPEFMDALERIPHDVDLAAQVPHGALRVFVMGQRGADREPATGEDIQAMADLAEEGIRAGALGFTTSRTLNHRTSEGDPTPTLTASEDELVGIAKGVGRAGAGVLQVVSDFKTGGEEFNMLCRMAGESGRPLSVSLTQNKKVPDGWQRMLQRLDQANTAGIPLRAQVCGRAVGIILGLDLSFHPFRDHRTWREIADLPQEERLAKLRDPDFRDRLLRERVEEPHPFVRTILHNLPAMYTLDEDPDYEPPPEASLGARAAAIGGSVLSLALDELLQHDGTGMLYFPFLNYAGQNLDPSLEMMRHPHTVLGLGDGGAHVGMICDSSFPTFMLTHWTRDRKRGARMKLEEVIRAQTRDTACSVGLLDRGLLKAGYKADLNVIDYESLRLHRPEVRHDLPDGGRRLIQKADGYVATVVSGQVTYRNGRSTGAWPGQLIRGPREAPLRA